MAVIKKGNTISAQLATGASVLAGAGTCDTKLVAKRLEAFAAEQARYVAAHEAVGTAEATLDAAKGQLLHLDRTQSEAVERLARALVFADRDRVNPFAGYDSLDPQAMKRLKKPEKAMAIRHLSAVLRRDKSLTEAVVQALDDAEKAAIAMEEGISSIDKLERALVDARHARQAISHTWDSAFDALKDAARSAAHDGGANLFAALFERTRRPTRNTKEGNGSSPTKSDAPVDSSQGE